LPQYVSAEARTLKPLILLAALGFDRFRVIEQSTGHLLPLPPRGRDVLRLLKGLAREGTPARRALRKVSRFVRAAVGQRMGEHHSSGPLPWELAGPWLTDEEASLVWLDEWRSLRYPRTVVERNDLWLDLHASRSSSR